MTYICIVINVVIYIHYSMVTALGSIVIQKFIFRNKYYYYYYYFGGGGKFYWDRVPDFVVGRIGYDNWLAVMAQRWNISLIDGTQTLHNLHQEGADGRDSGRLQNKGKNKLLDYEVAGNFKYKGGVTTCPFWRSVNCSRPISNRGKISSVCLGRVRHRRRCRNPDPEKVRERD